MARHIGSQKRPSKRMKSRSTSPSKLKGTTKTSKNFGPGTTSHEKRMT